MTKIKVACPNCQAELLVAQELLGKKGRCPRCRNDVFIQHPGGRAPDAAQASSDDIIIGWLDEGAKDEKARAPTPPARRNRPPAKVVRRTGPAAARTPQAAPNAKGRFPVKLDHVDEMGAFFRFASDLLYKEDFRSIFPQQCLICGAKRPLSVHLVFWSSKLPSTQASAVAQQARQVYTLRKVSDLSGKDLLSVLDPIEHLPEPYCLPFPYYVCNSCSAVGAVITDVHESRGRQMCELGVSSLPQAEFFTIAVCGQDSQAHQQIRQAILDGFGRPWQQLPLTVRIRINRWYEAQEGERFLCYIPDTEFAKAEAGLAGLVLTDLRLIFRKGLGRIELQRSEPIDLEAIDTDKGTDLIIIAPNGKRVVMKTNQPNVKQLRQLMLRTD